MKGFARISGVLMALTVTVSSLTGCSGAGQTGGGPAAAAGETENGDGYETQTGDGSSSHTGKGDGNAAQTGDSTALNPGETGGSKADGAVGEWEMVYTLFHSEYGNDNETYDSCVMSDDPYSATSRIRIGEKDGSLVADYIYEGVESEYRYFGNELEYIDEPAYRGFDENGWCLVFKNPFEEEVTDNRRFTLTEDERLIAVTEYTDGEPGTEDYYYSRDIACYLRKDSEKLRDREQIRYFDTVAVSNEKELLDNIGSNRKLVLSEGTYDLSMVDAGTVLNEHVQEEYGAVKITGVYNFCIEAEKGADVLICVDVAEDPVIHFEDSGNIVLRSVTAGHNVEKGNCGGSVVKLSSTGGVLIDDCSLYGCGTYGVEAMNSDNIEVKNSEIYECSYGLVDLTNVSTAHFTDCVFRDCRDLSMIGAYSCYDIVFDKCTFKDNFIDPRYTSCYFVDMSEYSDVTFNECEFKNNRYKAFANRKVKLSRCVIRDNGDSDMENAVMDDTEIYDAETLRADYEKLVRRQEEIDSEFETNEDLNQTEMNSLAAEKYEMWDGLLNRIWSYLKNTLPEDELEELTEKQKEWIKEKEASVKEAGAEFEGGSMQPMVENATGSEITRKRVEYLMDRVTDHS